jgi:hypothetical protein
VFGTAPLHIFSAASCFLAKQVQLHATPPKWVLHKFLVFVELHHDKVCGALPNNPKNMSYAKRNRIRKRVI